MQPVDIGRIATDVHELLKKSTGNGVELTLEIDPDLPGMKADPSQMRSVLMNLTLNAIAACEGRENGGRVDVQLRRKARDVAIRVSDNGKGIPENLKDQIYEPFFTTRKDGLGLGLAIVKRIVDYQGGKIQLRSKPEEGTTFEVTLKGDGK
jgi:signal transduction histidine kinase